VTTPTLGERVADLRRLRAFSQRELASEMKLSESWVSQVERDVQPIERLSVLQALARARRQCSGPAPRRTHRIGRREPRPQRPRQLAPRTLGARALGVVFATAEAGSLSTTTSFTRPSTTSGPSPTSRSTQRSATPSPSCFPGSNMPCARTRETNGSAFMLCAPVPTRPRRRLSPGRTRPTPPGLQPIGPSVPLSCLEGRSR